MNDVTRILSTATADDPRAAEELLPLLYGELRKLAAHHLAHEKPGQTLQATALVHEAYLRLVGAQPTTEWNGRGHFFAAAAEAMRRILIERARSKASVKHGGQHTRLSIPDVADSTEDQTIDLMALDEALKDLEKEHPENAAIVKLRFFAGLNLEEIAAAVGVSRTTAERRWAYARAWLFGRLHQ